MDNIMVDIVLCVGCFNDRQLYLHCMFKSKKNFPVMKSCLLIRELIHILGTC